jgi:hypothetical protein
MKLGPGTANNSESLSSAATRVLVSALSVLARHSAIGLKSIVVVVDKAWHASVPETRRSDSHGDEREGRDAARFRSLGPCKHASDLNRSAPPGRTTFTLSVHYMLFVDTSSFYAVVH